MVSELQFVQLWSRLSPDAEEALVVGLSCPPDAAEPRSPVDVLTVLERVVDHAETAGLVYGLTARDVHDLLAGEPPEVVPVGTVLAAADVESTVVGSVTIEPVHLLLGLLAFDSLAAARELAWADVTYERLSRMVRRRFRLHR